MLTKAKLEQIYTACMESDVLSVLLIDRTSGENILWGSDDYSSCGNGFAAQDSIESTVFTGAYSTIIKTRSAKNADSQNMRSREKGEVFTPSWVCNAQNNLVDNAWFGTERRRFNKEKNNSWRTNYYPINFPDVVGKTWKDYVLARRMEITCGEAPYLTSRYDTVSGKFIPVKCRIGLLDRKLRVITENTNNSCDWIFWSEKALQNTYGYDWQGDNVFLARRNLLLSVVEYFYELFDSMPQSDTIKRFAEIISWNIWQMDGIKFVIPNSCHSEADTQMSLFEEITPLKECPGCKSGNHRLHNGNYCVIRDWQENKDIRFIDLMKGEES